MKKKRNDLEIYDELLIKDKDGFVRGLSKKGICFICVGLLALLCANTKMSFKELFRKD